MIISARKDRNMNSDLDLVMRPKSIALIGASTKEKAVGHVLLKKLVEFGYTGKITLVHPSASEILGYKCYKTILEIPEKIDLAVVMVPRDSVFEVIEECGQKGIKGIVIISAGFKETGEEGNELENKLKEICLRHNMQVVGPNCMGVINTEPGVRMNATFSPVHPIPGRSAFVSQSGALGIAVLNVARDMNIGMSQFVSMGNKMIVSGNTLLEYWAQDPNTDLILMYLESFGNPKKFQELATKVSKQKPIIVVKSGTSEAGAAAASSHTGALAGTDKAASAMFSQCGIIREKTMIDMFEVSQAFANSPLPKSNRIAILTNAGGPGIMGTDAAITHGLEIAKLSDKTTERLKAILPPQASVRNPVDTIAAVTPENYEKCLHYLLEDPSVDSVIALLVPLMPGYGYTMSRSMMEAQLKYKKPVLGVIMSTDDVYKEIYTIKDLPLIPIYKFPESAAYALSRMYEYSLWKNKPFGKIKNFNDVNKTAVEKMIHKVLDEKRDMLTTLESMDILKNYGINTCKYAEAKNANEAVQKAEQIGYPVVMKILSKTFSHKSDVGGVIVNIQSSEQLRTEYNDLMARAKQNKMDQFIDGVMIQEMIKGQREIVLGSAIDPQYGPLMMFGLGGIFIEAMKDVVFKVHPITDLDAQDMLESTKSYQLLKGFRGLKGVDLEMMKDQLLRLSQLLTDFNFIEELDINPYIITDKTGETMAVDARIKLKVKTKSELDSLKTCATCK